MVLRPFNGRDLRPFPLEERRNQLRALLIEADNSRLRFSDFPDPDKLLVAASRMGLEGIVSKRREQPSLRTELRLDQGQDGCLARGQSRSMGDV